MALSKTETVDKIEVIGEFSIVSVRTATIIVDDGVEQARSYRRKTIAPGDSYAAEEAKVQDICRALHTDAAVSAYNSSLES